MYCRNCGAELWEDAEYCGICGAPVAQATQPAQPSETAANEPTKAAKRTGAGAHSSKIRPIALVAIIVVLLGSGIAWAVTRGPLSDMRRSAGRYADVDMDALFSSPVGSTVTFGHYEQDGNTSNGDEPLEWIVADKQGSRVQLITCDLIDYQPYDSKNAGFTWIEAPLRTWLNTDFVDSAFSKAERSLVRDTIMAYPGQPWNVYDPYVDEPAWDQAFLLSSKQALELFSDDASRAANASAYANDLPGAPSVDSWWLRTTGFERFGAGIVTDAGEIDGYGVSVVENKAYVRPSIWVALPGDMVEDDDLEGRFGVFADAIAYMSDDSLYALADLDKDGAPELVLLSSTWEEPDTWGVYLYGYSEGQALYLGQVQIPDCTGVKVISVPEEGKLYLYGTGSQSILICVTLSGSTCSSETVAQGKASQVEEAVNFDGESWLLQLKSCNNQALLDTVLDGWVPSSSGTPGNGTGTVLDEYRSQATSGMTSDIIDMDDTGTRHDLNLFLSNFTEKSSTFTFDWNTCTDEDMCLFAIDHTRLNYPTAVENASGAGVRNASGEACDERVAFDIFAKYPRVFLKKDFDASNVVDPCVVDGGYVYFPSKGWHIPNGVAYVTSTTDIDENRILVSFDVYGDGVDYVVTDESYYTCTSAELMQKLGVSGISRTGYAVVEPVDDGSVAPFKLWGFEST